VSLRRMGQLSLADAMARRGGRSEVFLARLDGLVNWPGLEATLRPVARSRGGAPGYPPLLLLKALLLQQWYGLSDPGLEDALSDRLWFRRFVGLALDEAAPDHSTISRFRTALSEHALTERVFAEVLRQIEARHLVLKQGTMIDATLVDAAVNRPRKPKPPSGDQAQAASAPEAAPVEAEQGAAAPAARPPSKLVLSEVAPDARWTKKRGVRRFGYKGHVGVDQGSGFIRRRHFTAANVADTLVADQLIVGDEAAVYADAAYDTHARRAALKARRAKDRIAHRANKHHKLRPSQLRRNKAIAKRRGVVEQVFATAKQAMGWWRARYLGLRRNAAHFDLICTAINLRRLAMRPA
jgi:IS5 family transposase